MSIKTDTFFACRDLEFGFFYLLASLQVAGLPNNKNQELRTNNIPINTVTMVGGT